MEWERGGCLWWCHHHNAISSADLLWVSGYSAVNCRVLQKDHPTCSGGLPLLEWASIICHVAKVHRYVTWGRLYSEVQTRSNFSETPFQFSSFSTSLMHKYVQPFSVKWRTTLFALGWQFYDGLCRMNTFLPPAEQNISIVFLGGFFRQKTLLASFLKVGASAL